MFRFTSEDSPVFVQLIANGLVRNLALPPNEERALVVGSTAGADFHVTGLRVAPVQFHLERHEGAVWLIPAYGIGDLRVNAVAVLGPTPLEEHNVIKFAGVHLDVTIRDAEAFVASGDRLVDDKRSNREFRASYSMDLPGEADTTQLAMPPLVASSGPEDEWPTSVIQPVSLDSDVAGRYANEGRSSAGAPAISRREQHTHRIVPVQQPSIQLDDGSPEFTPHGTQIIPAYRPPLSATEQANEAPRTARGPRSRIEPNSAQEDTRTVDTVRLVPLRNAPRPQPVPPRPTATKLAAARASMVSVERPPDRPRAVTPPPLGRHPLSLVTPEAERPTHQRASEKMLRPAGQPAFLARLGLLTKARPLLVGCFAGTGAALLTILLLATTRVAAPRPAQATAQRAPILVAELNSLRPATLAPTPAPASAPISPAATEVAKARAPVRTSASAQAVQASSAPKISAEPPRPKSLY